MQFKLQVKNNCASVFQKTVNESRFLNQLEYWNGANIKLIDTLQVPQ